MKLLLLRVSFLLMIKIESLLENTHQTRNVFEM